jgi:hypothetical protein
LNQKGSILGVKLLPQHPDDLLARIHRTHAHFLDRLLPASCHFHLEKSTISFIQSCEQGWANSRKVGSTRHKLTSATVSLAQYLLPCWNSGDFRPQS